MNKKIDNLCNLFFDFFVGAVLINIAWMIQHFFDLDINVICSIFVFTILAWGIGWVIRAIIFKGEWP